MFKKIILISAVMMLSGCITPPPQMTKGEAFPNVYKEKPASILVVPAVNHTTAADAIDLFSTTIAYPLAESGYYVLSVPYTKKFLEREGVVDGAQAKNVPLEKYKQLFGADAVLFVDLNKWDTNYNVLSGNVTVAAKFELYSTATQEKIWNYDSTIVYNTSGNSNNPLVNLISTAIQTATTDYVPVARIVNGRIISTLPTGQYHPRHDKDQLDKGILVHKVSTKEKL
ncbi:MAG: DUF799 family lipoprotein [Shewanella sp.]|nr:DUF799 family lipoprotein [Shewanella sp.]